MPKNFYVYQETDTNYIYCEKKNDDEDEDIDYNISIQNYVIVDNDNLPEIISNYFICDPLDNMVYFGSILWDKIVYMNDDYNPYNYDPDPKCIVYRDDIDSKLIDKYLFIINELSKKFYEPTTYYKHFNPNLDKISLEKYKLNNDNNYIVDEINNLIKITTI